MTDKHRIVVIGAVNIDLIGYPKEKLIFKDSNKGTLETILGGVGRNIAENLSKLGLKVEFLSVLGEDDFAKKIKESCRQLNISTAHCLSINNSSSSVYMAVMNINNDMAIALDAMGIYEHIPDNFIIDNLEIIKQNDYCLLETNMPQNILELVTNQLPDFKFALDAVSGKKALKAKTILHKLAILKCNLIEAEILSDIKVNTEKDYKSIVLYFNSIGVNKVFITLGEKGIIYGSNSHFFKKKVEPISPVNTTGAGDSFMAGLLYGEMHNFDIHKMVIFANACAQLTIQHKKNVHPNLSEQRILNHIK